MNPRYTFTLDVPAIGKAKKFNRFTGRGYNPDEVVSFLNLVTITARGVLPPRIFGPVRCQIEAYYEWPQSQWRTRYPRGYEPMTSKPDADNISKAILDGMRAYFDDKQVFDLRVLKFRVPQGQPARAVITIEEVKAIVVTDTPPTFDELPLLRDLPLSRAGP
jgi:Holliday junction resolvase RusA-like endonuclease